MNLRTDYALRMLMALAAKEEVVSIDWLAEHYDISRNHLAKVAQSLQAWGWIRSVRGRGGGLMLAHPPEAVCVGTIVRQLESFDGFVGCFAQGSGCRIDGACGLHPALSTALEAFLTALDGYTLADITNQPAALTAQLGIGA